MSECVVRMEMPSNCERCPMCGTESCGNGMYKLWCMCGDIPANSRKRPEDCPIICSLPEGHGRLVEEKSVRWAIDDIVLEIANRTGRVGMTKDETMEYINNLCTIVPEERSEHERPD